MSNTLADVQRSKSDIDIPIERVGITDFKMPIFVLTKSNSFQHTVADIDVFVDLAKEQKGISMSRIPIGIQKFYGQQLNAEVIEDISEYIRQKSEAQQCQVNYKFPYFIQKVSPVTKEPGICYYNIEFDITTKTASKTTFVMRIEVHTTSLCPCSKEISTGSAHNQRSKINIEVQPKDGEFIWIEDIIKIAESNSSCEIYSVLKRPDEKYVTEEAYNNPKFVEDMTRGIFNDLQTHEQINWFRVKVNNEESIHQHNATAIIESGV